MTLTLALRDAGLDAAVAASACAHTTSTHAYVFGPMAVSSLIASDETRLPKQQVWNATGFRGAP